MAADDLDDADGHNCPTDIVHHETRLAEITPVSRARSVKKRGPAKGGGRL